MGEAAMDPECRQLLRHRILAEALMQYAEIDRVERLVLVEAGEYDRLDTRDGVLLQLRALGANFFHHALHWRVDRGDRPMRGLETRLQHAVACPAHRRHHPVGADD